MKNIDDYPNKENELKIIDLFLGPKIIINEKLKEVTLYKGFYGANFTEWYYTFRGYKVHRN